VLGPVPPVVVLVAKPPQELIVVHATVLEVPGPLEAQHPEKAVANDRYWIGISHGSLRLAVLLQNVPDDLKDRELREVDEDDLGLVPEVRFGSIHRVLLQKIEEHDPGDGVHRNASNQPIQTPLYNRSVFLLHLKHIIELSKGNHVLGG
jgi:hypothetical protein